MRPLPKTKGRRRPPGPSVGSSRRYFARGIPPTTFVLKETGALGGNRTPDSGLRTPQLYPLSYEGAPGREASVHLHRIGALEGTRTPGLQVRNLSLYPLSYERASLQPLHSRLCVLYTCDYPRVNRGDGGRAVSENKRCLNPHPISAEVPLRHNITHPNEIQSFYRCHFICVCRCGIQVRATRLPPDPTIPILPRWQYQTVARRSSLDRNHIEQVGGRGPVARQ